MDSIGHAEETVPMGDPSRQFRVVGGRKIYVDADGFLGDFQDWSEEVAEVLAADSGLTSLTDTHWKVLRFLREFYANNGRVPKNRQVREGTGLSMLELEGLFPDGIRLGARRIAGLPINAEICY